MAIFELIEQNHPEAAFSLLEQNPDLADEVGGDGTSACMLALYHGHRELAEAIASQKSSLTLFEAAAFGRVAELEKLTNSETVREFSPDGFQPLHLAAYFGRNEAVRFLLTARAPLNEKSRNLLGVTPLHSALSNRHETIVRELIYEGADVNVCSSGGWTPLHYVAQSGNKPLLLFLKDHGAVFLGPGKSPADTAEEFGFSDLATLLR